MNSPSSERFKLVGKEIKRWVIWPAIGLAFSATVACSSSPETAESDAWTGEDPATAAQVEANTDNGGGEFPAYDGHKIPENLYKEETDVLAMSAEEILSGIKNGQFDVCNFETSTLEVINIILQGVELEKASDNAIRDDIVSIINSSEENPNPHNPCLEVDGF